jgi:hypothetical protein
VTPETQLELFLDKYSPAVADDARHALAFLQERLPTATRLVYDNYNALVVGFGPSEKASEAILSIAVYPAYVSLFLLNGAKLDDPNGLLEGHGAKVRHIKLRPVSRIESAEVLALIGSAVAKAHVPLPHSGDAPLIVKSISPRQRPRRSQA